MLFQPHKLETKECFNLCAAKDPFLKAKQFLFSQTVQKMHTGTDFQTLDLPNINIWSCSLGPVLLLKRFESSEVPWDGMGLGKVLGLSPN